MDRRWLVRMPCRPTLDPTLPNDGDVVECSHQRIDRTTRNREQSKERNRRKEEAWAKLEAERKAAENLKA